MKRYFDLTLALIGIIILLPLFTIICLLVLFKIGHPVFFLQERPGKNGKPFRIIKFRTMTDQTDSEGELLPNAERLTKFGIFLRAASLDELPEFINVLKGDMSLVGPRPLLMDYMPLFNDFQKQRHKVKPGITGWAQINGRNALSWDEKFQMDVWYVQNQSFTLDMQIIWLSIMKVIKREGIAHEGDVAMPRFTGNPG